YGEVVIVGGDDVGVIPEFLDVDDGDFQRTTVIVGGHVALDIAGKGIAAVDDVHDKPAQPEFVARLLEQVQPVDDEVEPRYLPALLEPVGEKAHVVERQRG